MFGTLQRMILWDLIRVFAVTLAGLTGLFALAGLVAEASQRGLAPAQMLAIVPLMIPSMLPYTIPAATLFACINVYGRLAKDNEIVALRAAGVNLRILLAPSLVLGLIGTSAAAGLYYRVIPRSFQLVRARVLGDTNELLATMLKRNGCIRHPKLPYVLFVRDVRGDRLIDAVFKRRVPKSPNYDTVARAREAKLYLDQRVDEAGKPVNEIVVEMTNCIVCNDSKKGDSPATLSVRQQEYRERLPSDMFGERDIPRACDLDWESLVARTGKLRQREAEREMDIRMDEARLATMSQHEREVLGFKKSTQKYAMREFRSYLAEIQLRPALALGCMCFALIGVPVGIWTARADVLSSFVLGFLPTVVLYYPLLMCGTNLAKDGKLPMPPAVWCADVIFAAAAAFLSWRLVRR